MLLSTNSTATPVAASLVVGAASLRGSGPSDGRRPELTVDVGTIARRRRNPTTQWRERPHRQAA
jgi:hypothetical protein